MLELDHPQLFDALYHQGYAIVPEFLSKDLREQLYQEALLHYQHQEMDQAQIGQGCERQIDNTIRGDFIYWLSGETEAQQTFLAQIETFKQQLNQQFYLGINGYEAHFALYPAGKYYKKHWDNFRGRGNRIVTTVIYLNPTWEEAWGGQLRLYAPDEKTVLADITPQPGMMTTFISNEIPHEVLLTHKPRVSIAGWLRRDTRV